VGGFQENEVYGQGYTKRQTNRVGRHSALG